MVIGLTIFEGGKVGAAYLSAVFISNLPESISSTSGLITGGWKKARILWMCSPPMQAMTALLRAGRAPSDLMAT
jgi:ZIP family zinc transporter